MQFSCRVEFSTRPFAPTVCKVENACLQNYTLTLYDKSPYSEAFHDLLITTNPMGRWDPTSIKLQVLDPSIRNEDEEYSITPAVAIERKPNFNVGHVWGDEIWPIFQMLQTYGAEKDDFQIITTYVSGGPPWILELFKQIGRGKPVLSVLEPFTANRCYEIIYIGSNGMSYSEGSQHARSLVKFRDFIFDRFDIVPQALRRRPNILILLKSMSMSGHKSGFENGEEIIATIKTTFPELNVDVVSWVGMPYKDQMEIMQSSDIVFSLPGSDIMNALFLPFGSTLVVPCRKVDVIEGSNEIRIWFNVFPYLRAFEVCGDGDVTFEGQSAIINLKTLQDYMKFAVHDWHSRRSMHFYKNRDFGSNMEGFTVSGNTTTPLYEFVETK